METLTRQQVAVLTDNLKEVVAKASKVCSCIEAFPLTCVLQLKTVNGSLQVIATDQANTIILTCPVESGTELNALVDVKVFSALISKLSTKTTELTIEGENLVVKANGTYQFKMLREEDGSTVDITIPEFDFTVPRTTVSNADLKSVLSMNKSCKAEMKETPALFNYYFDADNAITTDYTRVCINPVKFFNNAVCLNPTVMELLQLLTDKEGSIGIYENGSTIAVVPGISNATDKNVLIATKESQADVEEYPVEGALSTLKNDYPYTAKVNRTALLNTLDRVCLFSNPFDNNSVNLTFSKTGVAISTKRSNTSEQLNFADPAANEQQIKTVIEGAYLKALLSAIMFEDIVIGYGNEDGSIMMKAGEISLLVSAQSEEEE